MTQTTNPRFQPLRLGDPDRPNSAVIAQGTVFSGDERG